MSEQTQGKGRPTPKRKEASRQRGGPVTPPSTNRREAARQLREKQAANRKSLREGALRGDESKMLKRDQGPVRRHMRDVIDGRRTLGWILLPIAVLVIIAGLSNTNVQALTFELWLAACVAVGIDMLFISFALRRELREGFPDEKHRSHVMYGLMRTLQMRRLRVPRPQVRP